MQNEPITPARLLRRLDEIGASLGRRDDAIAVIGLGSVGVDLERLDEHSDLDFFVIVDEGAKPVYLRSIDWLEAVAPVQYSFENSVDGRKVLDWLEAHADVDQRLASAVRELAKR